MSTDTTPLETGSLDGECEVRESQPTPVDVPRLERAVREKLEPYLKTTEIDALLKRRQKLVKEIDKRIAKHGEQAILFEFVSG